MVEIGPNLTGVLMAFIAVLVSLLALARQYLMEQQVARNQQKLVQHDGEITEIKRVQNGGST